jgi:2-hydroxy-3-oxopropionate reductase
MSTISPFATRAIAAKLESVGIDVLDAPVSGGDVGARNATLSIMVGGRRDVFERTRPIFESLGKNIVHVGDHGAGQLAKACNNLVVAVTLEGVAEAFALARRAGVDPANVRAALLGGFAQSKVLDAHGLRIIEENFAPGFKARLHRKDLAIALDEAAHIGITLSAVELVKRRMDVLIDEGNGDLDSSAIVKVVERGD